MRSGDSWVLEQEETFEVWVSVGSREATYRRQPSLPSVWKRLGQRQAVMLREGEGRDSSSAGNARKALVCFPVTPGGNGMGKRIPWGLGAMYYKFDLFHVF